ARLRGGAVQTQTATVHTDAAAAARRTPAPPTIAHASDADVARFLERFRRFGAAPSVETYMPLFHPEATLFDDGMERPIGYDEIPASIEATLALVQGFVMAPERWRVSGGALFVEARNEATIFGARKAWRSVYRIDLDGDRVRRGRRYYDRAPLLAALEPEAPRLADLLPAAPVADDDALARPAPPGTDERGLARDALVALLARCWRGGSFAELGAHFRDDAVLIAPGAPTPLHGAEAEGYLARLATLLRGAVPVARAVAGDDALVFVEWEASVPTARGTY